MKLAKSPRTSKRRFPIGAEILPSEGVHFRVWSPRSKYVEAVIFDDAGSQPAMRVELKREEDGYFSGTCAEAGDGTLYGFRLDDDPKIYPDPASRYQPRGPHGPSQVIDASSFSWSDSAWQGVSLHGQIIYEMHIGTFTPEGTLAAATKRLPYLVELGVTVLEVMPVAEFDGEFGWGYDGVDLFAPTRNYGTPDELRKFVDTAHSLGLGVILDVVYNHLGPSGNYLPRFSQDYFSHRHHTDWGDAINYDGENNGPVREFFLTNARYWIEEFHFDGLRVDAVHAVFDDTAEHVLGAMGCAVRKAAGGRKTIIVVENEFQDTRLLRGIAEDGCGMDGAWNDDFHHAARVALTGDADYYFGDYLGTPQELISAVKWGHLYQGQWNHRQKRQRGGITWGLKGECFVNFLQNHDQVGNSPGGARLHMLTSGGRYRAMTAVLLLAPGTPMLFQGQEYCATTPFHYFADHDDDFRKLVREGREKDCRKFRRLSDVQDPRLFLDPGDRAVFEACKLHHEEHHANSPAMLLHRDLIRIRKEDAVIAAQNAERVHGAVLGPEAFAIRYFGEAGDDRLLVVNLGRDLAGAPIAEPLLAPSAKGAWEMFWTSEEPRYGGLGVSTWDATSPYFHGHTAVLLRPKQS
jgi:maltooligosyltrehalose trehalohydrolase